MKTVIFVGPSLPEAEVKRILPDAMVLPPAEQGDIDFARYQLGADIIGLIDGKHTMVLPPLHKEILSVLDDGCRLVGAASMGALRAVECEDFGAEPVGEVARMYKEGEIDADDEVCLAHAGPESGYKHLSIPMVNIRATLKNSDIDDDIRQEITEYAKALYYPDREWQNIFDACDVSEQTGKAIHDSFCDIKEADSLHLCYCIAQDRPIPAPNKKIKNAHYGFSAVFENNDRKILHGGRVIRKYQIAEQSSKYDRMNARNRMLALELCKIIGLQVPMGNPCFSSDLDMSLSERAELFNQEMLLNTAGEWIISRASSADVVRSINDFLRISGRYEETKDRIL